MNFGAKTYALITSDERDKTLTMKKSERTQASIREDGVDMISNLPDPILLLILSGLPSIEEVIQTSILSTRWRYLWTSIPYLNIVDPGTWNKINKNKFNEFVYWVLLNRSTDLDIFRLSCSNYYDMSTVGRWIHAAVKKNVRQLGLMFCPNDESENIEMPHCLVTCGSLEVLRLSLYRRRLSLPNFTGFPALRVLELQDVELFNNDLVNDFLKNCPLLEDLTLSDCLIKELDLLCISCLKLKQLQITNWEMEGLCGDLKICCPKLVFLEIQGRIANKFIFESLTLKEAVFQPEGLPLAPELMRNTISVFFAGIYHVESLWIDFYFFVQCVYATRDLRLPNLKNLVLNTTIDAFIMEELIRIFKYYPKLESLNLIVKQEFFGSEYWKLDEAEARRILTRDMKRVEFLEYNEETPTLDIKWDDTYVEMVFSWGNLPGFVRTRL